MAKRNQASGDGDNGPENGTVGSEGSGPIGVGDPIANNSIRDGSFGNDGTPGGTPNGEVGVSGTQDGAREVPNVETPKKRGRKSNAERLAAAAATATQSAGRVVLNAKEIAPKIQGLHNMLAIFTKQPVFNLSDGEAMLMATSIAEVSQYYDLNIMTGPRAALFNLAAVCGMIYVPKIMAISAERKAARAAPPVDMHPVEGDIIRAMADPEQPKPKGMYDLSALGGMQ